MLTEEANVEDILKESKRTLTIGLHPDKLTPEAKERYATVSSEAMSVFAMVEAQWENNENLRRCVAITKGDIFASTCCTKGTKVTEYLAADVQCAIAFWG